MITEFDRQPQGRTQNAKPTALILKPTGKDPPAIYVVGRAFLARKREVQAFRECRWFILVWEYLTGIISVRLLRSHVRRGYNSNGGG
jgi:hypothetical protein